MAVDMINNEQWSKVCFGGLCLRCDKNPNKMTKAAVYAMIENDVFGGASMEIPKDWLKRLRTTISFIKEKAQEEGVEEERYLLMGKGVRELNTNAYEYCGSLTFPVTSAMAAVIGHISINSLSVDELLEWVLTQIDSYKLPTKS